MIHPNSPPRLVTLIFLTALSVMSLNMFLPSLANIAAEFDAPYALVSLAIGGYLAMTAVVQIIAGPLSDRIGRRPVALGALVLFVVASIGCALSENVWVFLGFRMLQAAMISGHAMSMAIVRDTHEERAAAGKLAFISMSMALAPMLGPMLGGVLDTAFGWRANFWLYTGVGLLILTMCLVDLGETRPTRGPGDTSSRGGRMALLTNARFWGFSLCSMFSVGAFYVFITGAPLIAADFFGISTAELGIFIGSITIGFMAGTFISTRLAPRYDVTTMMLAGRIVACGGLAAGVIVLLAGELHIVTYFGATIFVGIGNGLTIPSANAGALSVRPDLAGTAAGTNGALMVAGGAVLTSLTGAVLVGPGAPLILLGIMLAASVLSLLATIWARAMRPAVRA